MLRAFASKPVPLPSAAVARLSALQSHFNKLYAAVSQDDDFLHGALGEGARKCAWLGRELNALERLASTTRHKPLLLLPNSVYLQPLGNGGGGGDGGNGGGGIGSGGGGNGGGGGGNGGDGGGSHAGRSSSLAPTRTTVGSSSASASDDAFTLTVGNVQAGEPYQLELVHTYQNASSKGEVLEGPLRTACAAIAAAARAVHPHQPTVAIVSKPVEKMAMRTRVDIRGVGERLLRAEGVARVLYTSMADLAHARLNSAGDLVLNGIAISLLYSRFDFSHPAGCDLQKNIPPPKREQHSNEHTRTLPNCPIWHTSPFFPIS